MSDFNVKQFLPAEYGLAQLELGRTLSVSPTKGCRERFARDNISGGVYALKIVRKGDLCSEDRHEQTKAALFVMSRLRCVFARELLHFFQDDSCLYYLLEYLPAGDLFALLRSQRTLSSVHAQFYIIELASALLSLHNHSILLRALCPEAVALTSLGHVRLTDFDLAKVVVSSGRTYTVCGTPEYMSPEAVMGAGYHCCADWWALGVLLFELLTGCTPFRADSLLQMYRNIERRALSFPRSCPRGDKALVSALLEPAHRRLGVRGGEAALKAHAYFYGVDWNAVDRELLAPLLKPAVRDPGDTSNYDFYPEENTEEGCALNLGVSDRDFFAELEGVVGRHVQ